MADFTTTPDFVLDEAPTFRTLVTQFENGYEQRRNKWASGLRTWNLQYKNRSTSEFETVRDFFIAKKGQYTSFTWTNPNDSTDYTVRFDADSLTFKLKAYGIYDFSFRFIEVKA